METQDNGVLYTGVVDMEINAPDNEEGVIYGYAARYGNLDRNGNIIQKGALNGKKNQWVPLLWNHWSDVVIGSAWVSEDEKGMPYKAKFAIDSKSEEVRKIAEAKYSLVRDGHVRGNSIGFIPQKYDFRKKTLNGEEIIYRHIETLDLAEITICPVPANPKAGVKKLSLSQDEITDMIGPLQAEVQELRRQMEQLKTGQTGNNVRSDLDGLIRSRMRFF